MKHLYTGDGKGKTTTAVGLVIRALGWHKKVLFVQFFKQGKGGEISILKDFDNVEIIQIGIPGFVMPGDIEKMKKIREKYDFFMKNFDEYLDKYDIIVFDEFTHMLNLMIVSYDEFKKFILSIPDSVEFIITGRTKFDEMYDLFDYVTKMEEVKHPFNDGFEARRGVEF